MDARRAGPVLVMVVGCAMVVLAFLATTPQHIEVGALPPQCGPVVGAIVPCTTTTTSTTTTTTAPTTTTATTTPTTKPSGSTTSTSLLACPTGSGLTCPPCCPLLPQAATTTTPVQGVAPASRTRATRLAFTGAPSVGLLSGGISLIVLGGAMLAISGMRRRRESSTQQ